MLFMMKSSLHLSALPCSVCGIRTPGLRRHALVSPANTTMQLIMWQRDVVWVVHHIMEGFEAVGALDDALMMHQPHLHQP